MKADAQNRRSSPQVRSDLRVEPYRIPAADLGPANPLPPLRPARPKPLKPADEGDYGKDVGVLPHRMQDGYNRDRRGRDFLAVVLENDFLRATFLPEVGGKLWSLVHKPSGRELLFCNPVFQPCNLAIRNAWTSRILFIPCETQPT